jgi:hypothetical protein
MGSHAPVKSIKPFSAESKVIQALAMVVSLQAMTIQDLWMNVTNSDPRHNWIHDIPHKVVIPPLASKALEVNHGSLEWKVRLWSCFLMAADGMA